MTNLPKLFIVQSKEYPKNKILCSEAKLKGWVVALTLMGETPVVREITPAELAAMIPHKPHILN